MNSIYCLGNHVPLIPIYMIIIYDGIAINLIKVLRPQQAQTTSLFL